MIPSLVMVSSILLQHTVSAVTTHFPASTNLNLDPQDTSNMRFHWCTLSRVWHEATSRAELKALGISLGCGSGLQ